MNEFSSELHFEASAVVVSELKLVVVSVYHSTAGDPDIFLDSLDRFLVSLGDMVKYTVLIGGDLNKNFDITTRDRLANKFQNNLRQHNFYCLNHSPTRGPNCLDNVFTNDSKRVVSCNVLDFPYSDHNGILIKLIKQTSPLKPIHRTVFEKKIQNYVP